METEKVKTTQADPKTMFQINGRLVVSYLLLCPSKVSLLDGLGELKTMRGYKDEKYCERIDLQGSSGACMGKLNWSHETLTKCWEEN